MRAGSAAAMAIGAGAIVALAGLALMFPETAWAQKVPPVPEHMPSIDFPLMGNRAIIWIAAQMHILFASFILGVPFFVLVSEALYLWSADYRYERLAKEVIKVTAFCYSLTALLGGSFALLLFGLYPKITYYLFYKFDLIWLVIYPASFIAETILMYMYYYSWGPLSGTKTKKLAHIGIGFLLNCVGVFTLFILNAPSSYMNTPPRGIDNPTLWDNIHNFTWMPLNFHRLIGNITFGGYMVCIISAYMYFMSRNVEDKKYYDWQGYIGNLIGLGAMIPLPIMGYIYAYEFYMYDASLGMYMMSDRLSMYFEAQAVLVGFLFVASNLYMWLSMKRITGAERFEGWMKVNYVLIFFGAMIWFLPRHYFATMVPEPGMRVIGTELPSHLGYLALMKAKNLAAVIICLCTFANFFLYNRSVKTGQVAWGKVDPLAQYILIFLGFSDIWLMNLMGAVRELVRKSNHVYLQVKDTTLESYTPTLQYSGAMTTLITLGFFTVFSFIIWFSLRVNVEAKKHD
ncbi:MAG: cytochrome ubiquinol oxidase subunit I [Nitrospinae bacterium]|nr:cytochrome ubiquinol oxidase subunit I [Nitrospinota bacterium]